MKISMELTKEFAAITLFEKFLKDVSEYLEEPIEETEKIILAYLYEKKQEGKNVRLSNQSTD